VREKTIYTESVRQIVILVVLLLFLCGCKKEPTEDLSTNVVQLRDRLIDLARGNITEVTGSTVPEESYILLYGFSEASSLKSLPISDSLRVKLEGIHPPHFYERWVLAHVYKDDIQEYTEWEHTDNYYHTVLIQTPLVIKGAPYKLIKELGDQGRMVIKVRN
jgi:hypothetical protein